MNIYAKILAVQGAVGRVAKNGENKFHKYNYVTESDLMDALRPALVENKLAIVMTGMDADTGFKPDGKSWARVKVHYLIADAESDQVVVSSAEGYAEDSNDKAIYKAETGACKYFFYKMFMVSTGDDPECDDEAPGKPKPQARRAPSPAPAKAPAATPIQAGAPNPESLRSQIKAIRESRKMSWPEVSKLTGVDNILQCNDPGILSNVLSTLQAS